MSDIGRCKIFFYYGLLLGEYTRHCIMLCFQIWTFSTLLQVFCEWCEHLHVSCRMCHVCFDLALPWVCGLRLALVRVANAPLLLRNICQDGREGYRWLTQLQLQNLKTPSSITLIWLLCIFSFFSPALSSISQKTDGNAIVNVCAEMSQLTVFWNNTFASSDDGGCLRNFFLWEYIKEIYLIIT